MTSIDWSRIRPVIEQLFAMPESEHEAVLAEACGDDTSMRGLVLTMYAHEVGDAAPAVLLDESPAEFDTTEGAGESTGFVAEPDAIVGAWRLLECLQRDGADETWRAERVDGAFEMTCVIRLLPVRLRDASQRQLFEAEQQILARLEHPCIARLFDGGTTDDGRPWLVYEEFPGQSLERFVDEGRLGIEDRLRLFRRICDAVHHAHGHLVLHGDLDPGSIRVSDAGPKLLDVGVAKLCRLGGPWVDGSDPTDVDPRYASPEQVCGEWATTAADVYSLGVLLHELLTGRAPYDTEALSPMALTQFVCDTPPELPRLSVLEGDDRRERAAARGSTPRALSRRLAGDLDAIVAVALAKQPGQRYLGAALLAADIRLHLDHRPVRARGDGLLYRARTFARRHRGLVNTAALAAALLVVASLEVGGLALTEHRKAAQARAANAEQARRHGRDVGLFGALLDRSLDESLARAEELRRQAGPNDAGQVIDAAVADLDHLRVLVDGGSPVRSALARAYIRLGDVQGNPGHPGEGDRLGAAESYGRAVEIADALPPDEPSTWDVQALCASRLGTQALSAGALEAAGAHFERALDLAQRVVAAAPGDRKARTRLALAHQTVGTNLLDRGLRERGVWHLEHYRDQVIQLYAEEGGGEQIALHVGLSHQRLGNAAAEGGDASAARDAFREAVQHFGELADDDPDSTALRGHLAWSWLRSGQAEVELGNDTTAEESLVRALRLYSSVLEQLPADFRATMSLGQTLELLGDIDRTRALSLASGVARRRHWEVARDWYRLAVQSYSRHTSPTLKQLSDVVTGKLAECAAALAAG